MKLTGRALLALLLALVLAAGLCGCGGSGDPDDLGQGDPATDTEEPAIPPLVPVRVVTTRTADEAVLADVRYTYDEYGNKTAEIPYQFGLLPEGYYTYEYTYGPEGVPVKRSTYLQQQDLSQLTEVETFDTEGRLTGRQAYNADGKRTFEYAYDEQGNETLYLSCDEAGRMVSRLETAYDRDGQRVSERYTERDGSVTYREYEGELCCRRVETDSAGNESAYTYTIRNDAHGNLLTYSAVNDRTGALNFRRDYENTYDTKGRLTRVEVTDETGQCLERTDYRYDQEGRLIQTDGSRFAGGYTIRQVWDTLYDSAGVMLQRDCYESKSSGGALEETSSSYLYDQQEQLTGFTYRKDGGSLRFAIGRVKEVPVVLEKVCSGPLGFSDFDLVFTEGDEFTMDSTPYTEGDAAFAGADESYTRVYSYKEDGRLAAIEETAPDGTVVRQWTYTYQRPHNAPEQTVQTIPFNAGAASIAVYNREDLLLNTTTFVHDQLGRYTEMTTWEGTFRFVYEQGEDGGVVGRRYGPDGEARGSMTYDSHGNMVQERLYGEPHAIELKYAYDAVGNQMTSYPWSSSATAYCAYTYDEAGRRTGMALYDSAERLPQELLERYTYSYDREEHVSRVECRSTSGTLRGYILYQYDQ